MSSSIVGNISKISYCERKPCSFPFLTSSSIYFDLFDLFILLLWYNLMYGQEYR